MSLWRDQERGWFFVRASGALDIDEIVGVIATARATVENRMVPMLFDARAAHGGLGDAQVDRAVAAVDAAAKSGGLRAHVAVVASDDPVYSAMLRYEARCADIGVRVIRVFRQLPDAEHWLEIVSAARDLR
ncbi:MAG: hypothetical protein JWL71_3401 [Acidobacteria bacterium]|nr:hypothetical protein [Acidobacteriota bacterium]